MLREGTTPDRRRVRLVNDGIALLWGAASLLLGILTLLRAPSSLFLKAKVAATEYGYVLAVFQWMSLVLFRLPRFRSNYFTHVGRALTVAGSLLMCTPVVRAATFSKQLPSSLDNAFGASSGSGSHAKPLSLRKFLRPWPPLLSKPESVVFADSEEYRLEFDLYRPAHSPASGAPCVVVVHGGRWTEGNSRQFAALNAHLAHLGYAVVGVNYRKAGRYPFPAARDDLRAALEYVKRNAKELGVDPHKIVLLGRSAGGQLALLVAYERKDPDIKGVVSYYAPTDMHLGYRDPTNPRVINHAETLEVYLGGNPTTARDAYDAASPIRFVSAKSPPTLLLHGARDEIVHIVQSDRLAARLQRAGVRHLYLRLPWATHGFDHNLGGPSGQISTYAVERFLEHALATDPPA